MSFQPVMAYVLPVREGVGSPVRESTNANTPHGS